MLMCAVACNYLGNLPLLKENQTNQPRKKNPQQKKPSVFFGCDIFRI